MKRVLIILAGLATLLAASVMLHQHLWEPGRGERASIVVDRSAQLRQGAYLARAGNCMSCHTASKGMPYAGGNALSTPFGTMYGPNLTPDAATGIGRWTADDFWRALHNGKSRDGRLLYPAFPYPNYTRVSRADSDALYAFLRTLAPVSQVNREHALRFPYNQRSLLAFWRALYFSPGTFTSTPGQSAAWNRGAYLVQGLGHCSACHAARNAVGASLATERLGGGAMGEQGWHAPALGGARDRQELAGLLHAGVSRHDALAGPMADVVADSLQYLAPADVRAMADYLVTLPAPPAALPREPARRASPAYKLGERIYARQCASCHGKQGQGVPYAWPRLAGHGGQGEHSAGNAIRMVLQGGFAPATTGNPRPYSMPPFGAVLSDAEVAAVLSYVRSSWGNRQRQVAAHEVERLRSVD